MPCGGPPAPVAGLSLAEVLRAGLSSSPPSLPKHHWRILNALLACRTPRLGGHRYRCQQCGKSHFVPHSCRNRHCPLCQGQAAHQWLQQQQASLLPVPYFHLVFTLPHQLNPLIQQNQRALYTLLFVAASQTLLQFGQNRWSVQLGITAVLHSWSQTLLGHYHLHCIVTGGGPSADGSRWVGAPAHFLFANKALSIVFRGKFCSSLQQLYADKKLQFHGQLAPLAQPRTFQQLMRQATRHKWNVYAKRPFAGPNQVLAYLSRYTHRVAISPRRLLALDEQKQTVTFEWKDYAHHARKKTMSLGLKEFVRRFCLHLLPERFVKIRHFGFLSNQQRKARVAQVRTLLAKAAAAALAQPAEPKAPPVKVCPHCGSDRLVLIEIVAPWSAAPPRPLDSS
ncbi:MAG: IS91 family transposase [Deltaproteobacteria bacterium]|nr:MAG: IS91 family transposase [Deltaproteobacteria bacterium]